MRFPDIMDQNLRMCKVGAVHRKGVAPERENHQRYRANILLKTSMKNNVETTHYAIQNKLVD